MIFGVRKAENSLDEGLARKLQNVPNRKLKPLPETATAQYPVPVSPPLKLFRSTVIDPEELEKTDGPVPFMAEASCNAHQE